MEKLINKKAIIYCRVSTKEQVDEGNSLLTQERICREYADKNGYEVARVFIEEGESAKNSLRSELQIMMKYCGQNHKEIDGLIIYKIDRLSRNTDDYSQLRIFFNKFKIQILSTSEAFDNNPVGRFVENMLANVAQFDNDMRAERCKNGMIDAVKAGRYVFLAPFGYKNGTVNGEKNIVVDNIKSSYVKRIFELLATNLYSPLEVRKIITEEGARLGSGTKLSKAYFHRIIRNKVYKGVIDSKTFNIGEIKGCFEPLISEELFEMVQFILNKKGKRKAGYDVNNSSFPLRGLIVSENGHKLDGSWSKGNARQKMPYYRFRGLNGFNTRKDVLEEKYNTYLEQFEYKKDFVELLKESLLLNWEHRNQSNKQLKKQAEKKINELKIRQEQIISKNLKGIIDDELTEEQLNKIKQEIASYNLKLKDYDGPDNIQDVLNYSLAFMGNLSKEIEKLEIKKRKVLQWFLFPEGIIFDGEKLRTTRTALILNKKLTAQDEQSTNVDLKGFEPLTSCLQSRHSNQLNYRPMYIYAIVELILLATVIKSNP